MAINLTFAPPVDYHNQYPEDVWAIKVVKDLNDIVTAINSNFTIVDSSIYWTAADGSIWSWKVTKV